MIDDLPLAVALMDRGATAGAVTPTLSSDKRVLWMGDSTTAGVGAGSGGSSDVNGSRPNSTPLRAAAYLAGLGFNVATQTVNADNNNGISNDVAGDGWHDYRPEITVGVAATNATGVGAGLATAAQSPTIGGVQGIMSSSLQGFDYTLSAAADTIDFWLNHVASTGTLLVKKNGVTVSGGSIVNATGAPGIQRHTISGLSLVAGDVVSFARSLANCYLPFCIDIYDSTKKSWHIFNAGARNWTIEDWNGTGNSNSPQTAIANMGAYFDLLVVANNINNQRVAPGTYTSAGTQTNTQAFVDAALVGNPGLKVVFLSPNPISQGDGVFTGSWSNATMTSMYSSLQTHYGSAAAFVDTAAILAAHFGVASPATYALMNGAGLMHDTLHPNNGVGSNGDSIYNQMGIAAAQAARTLLGV